MALGFGFNKQKVLASAEKAVQQGKLQNAITEYEKVTKEDPKDLTVLNTIGDLYARVGQNDRAGQYFKRVGDLHAGEGFTVTAPRVVPSDALTRWPTSSFREARAGMPRPHVCDIVALKESAMWNWLVRLWRSLTGWKHEQDVRPYRPSNLHGRHR